jgi:hypothetical protein
MGSVNGFGSYKTAGEDGIFLGKELKLWLCHYVRCSRLVWLWQKVRVIFISKPGRSSYELTKSFRRQTHQIIFDIFPLENDGKASIKEEPLKDYRLNPMYHA